MLWKETHLRNPTHSRALFRIVLVLLILAELLYVLAAGSEFDQAEAHIFFATIEAMVLLLVVVVNASISVVSERSQGTLDLVHVTLVRPDDITVAKVTGTLRSVVVLVAFPCLHLLVGAVLSDLPMIGVAAFSLSFLIYVLFFAVVGVGFSITSRTPARAIVKGMCLLVFLVIVYPLLVAFVAFLLSPRGPGRAAAFFLCGCPAVVPPFLAEYTAEPFLRRNDEGFLTGAIAWSCIYLVLTGVRYRFLGSLYERVRRREQGRA